MTETEINVAIEAIMDRAWCKRRIQWDYATQRTTSEDVDINEKGIDVYWFLGGKRTLGKPVDYCGSLDAMRKALDSMLFSKRQAYYSNLIEVMSQSLRSENPRLLRVADIECCLATAKQQAEAFLRAHGKWID